jgi:hypothetical protein
MIFSVVIKGSDGKYLDLLANTIGKYSGQKSFTVPKDGKYLVEVSANGEWKIIIK